MAQLPKHVAIIMDGNGRWARARGQRRVAGHRAGVMTVRRIVEHAAALGVSVLSLFAFSLENLRRPPLEVRFLMKLMATSLQREITQLHQHNIRLKVIGDRRYLDATMKRQIEEAEALTAANTGLCLVICLHYSGRWDLAQAVQRITQLDPTKLTDAKTPEEITQVLGQYLATAEFGEPDLLIRTSGEQRISNFMLWQLAYTELFFSALHWPDFSTAEFDAAILAYQQRERRFGLTSQQLSEPHYA